ncbi:MAG TPA: hypothetical protein VM097_09990 [Mycobacteriales bacterium]|nr:hypothetical protein [Mycobacteriales bacterium]
MRAVRTLLVGVVALTPALTALTALRPVAAETTGTPSPFGSFGLTVTSAAVRTVGDVGVSGGLVTLGTGTGFTTARLDAAPSSYALATPVEPGPVLRSVVGTVNTEAGEAVLAVPEAESAYPGTKQATMTYAPVPPAGPVTVVPGAASSSAGPHLANGSATGSGLAIAGVMAGSRISSASSVAGTDTAGTASSTGTSHVGRLDVAGVLVLTDVVAHATVAAVGARTTSAATLTIGGASVGGVPVTIDADGVHAAGQGTGIGPLQDAQEQVNAALAAAGMDVHAIAVTKTVTGRSGYADSGGVVIHLVTPGVDPAGLPGNDVTMTIGKVTATSTTQAPFAPIDLPPFVDPGFVAPVPPTTTTTTVVDGGLGGLPGASGGPGPQVLQPRAYTIAGHRLSALAAFAGFAAWQLISMAMMTLYALADRRRRAALEVEA